MASENILPSAALAPPPTLREPARRKPLAPPPSDTRTSGSGNGSNGSGGRGNVPPAGRASAPKAGNITSTMPVLENVRVAIMGLSANKLRAALTMLGIIIGVAAVIAMIALGQGAREKTLNQIRSMGTNLLIVEPVFGRIAGAKGKAGSWNRLRPDDLDALLAACPSVLAISPDVSSRLPLQTQIKSGNQTATTTVVGSWPDWVDIRNYKMAMGRFFTTEELKKKAKVVVLGWEVYQKLYPDGGDPTDSLVRVNNVGVKCIGVMASKGQTGSFNADDIIAIPADTVQKRLFNSWMGRPRAFSAQAVTEAKMGDAQAEIDAMFRKRYRVPEGGESTITIRSQSELAQAAEDTNNTFTALLAGIAGVSLLVGGIGIMNIMLVSVTERTREIGIRKAIGAKRRDVLLQFLIEAVTLSLLGGLIGCALGIGIALTLPRFMPDTLTVITLSPILMSFGFSAAVGIFFGFYPAQKASKLDPIVALRYE